MTEDNQSRISAARDTIARLYEGQGDVLVGFGGGRDAIALVQLCEPYKERTTLLWGNTGHMGEHVESFIRGYGDAFRLQEVRSPDLFAYWKIAGIPTDLLPVTNAMGRSGVPMQPWARCCNTMRVEPLTAFLRGLEAPVVFLSGARKADGGPLTDIIDPANPTLTEGNITTVFPLWNWTDEDVRAFVESEALALPAQYTKGLPSSLRCITCPHGMTKERMGYLSETYPAAAQVARSALELSLLESRTTIESIAEAAGVSVRFTVEA